MKILKQLGIDIVTYTKSIGPVEIKKFDLTEINANAFYMPDNEAAVKASEYVEQCMADKDSSGGIIECRVSGLPAGIGDTVFDDFVAIDRRHAAKKNGVQFVDDGEELFQVGFVCVDCAHDLETLVHGADAFE